MAAGSEDSSAIIHRPTSRTKPIHDARQLVRRTTSRWRTLPDYLIIGAQKAGTTSLYDYLQSSPDIRPALTKEVHFFDRNFQRGPAWYRAHFPLSSATRDWVTGEASPYYLLHPRVPSLYTDCYLKSG